MKRVVAVVLLLSLHVYSAQKPAEGTLAIEVIEGEDATRVPGRAFAAPIRIRVTDEVGRPVPLAEVLFNLPTAGLGAGAITATRETFVRTETGENGVASSGTLRANHMEGDYRIVAVVEFYGKKAEMPIQQHNRKPPVYRRRSTWIWAASSAAAALVTIIVIRAQQQPTATITTVTPTGPVTHP